jgi:quercetin dioxygenase-like cupin family protein
MARVLSRDELPKWSSTRDGRDRLDLVTDAVGLGAKALKADRVVYHPGDTSANHYHVGSEHAFYVLYGSGVMYVDDEPQRLDAGDVARVGPGEAHWFENDGDSDFSFVEYWAPPPEDTVWLTADT